MLDLSVIEKPTLILDESRARRNLARMAAKARQQGVRFRPHFKTHQSVEMGGWFREEGVSSITVSSVDMAVYFAQAGWDDILIAFTANPRQVGDDRRTGRKDPPGTAGRIGGDRRLFPAAPDARGGCMDQSGRWQPPHRHPGGRPCPHPRSGSPDQRGIAAALARAADPCRSNLPYHLDRPDPGNITGRLYHR